MIQEGSFSLSVKLPARVAFEHLAQGLGFALLVFLFHNSYDIGYRICIQILLLIPGALLKIEDLPVVAPVGSRSIIATRPRGESSTLSQQ